MPTDNLVIGLNGRFFPANWRPALTEIEFAATHGFAAIQFRHHPDGLSADHLGAPLDVVGQALRDHHITAVMEIVPAIDAHGITRLGRTPLELLTVNLPAIQSLGCRCVHLHFVPMQTVMSHELADLETRLLAQLVEAARLGREQGFLLGLEHNEPAIPLFNTPYACATALAAVPDLYFVWDFNHTHPDDIPGFKALIPRVSLLHIADTPLPETNHHLPLGEGSVDLLDYCRALRDADFSGPAILEIGGLPKSGGYGRDTDTALIQSCQRLREANRF